MSKPFKMETLCPESKEWEKNGDTLVGKAHSIATANYEHRRFGKPCRIVDLTTKKVIFTVGEIK